ncbi:HypC/HybG/HupF family hydrogenase formation chaperone [Actinacidiphila acididurans]|uniref:HypC/HybG/HupF family hydrogenase formation chaperone n=1 Tax=Actinacidiphila acididurans TaxID=2784346 RepID=A0ABS2U3R8_9ACTN|nr:HypC/HybG/HupF family hydrogenase formation chaperone [Actinacidiphila acididurans]MBM9510257.1 HypC/HybG/HupF family hydrogenase formation chaperone [Actinacidiphila acididurans]
MCLAVPGRVTGIEDRDGTRMARVDFGGVEKDVCLAYVPDAEVGEYVIVHVGFALQKLDEASARASLELFEQLGLLEEEFGDPWRQAETESGAEAEPGAVTGAEASAATWAAVPKPVEKEGAR